MNPLAELVVKVSLILSAALLICLAFGRRSAALRHWVLAVGIVCGVATPLLMPLAPAWHAPIAPPVDPSPHWVPLALPAADDSQHPIGIDRATGPVETVRPTSMGAVALMLWPWLAGTVVGGLALVAGLRRLSRIRANARPVSGGTIWCAVADEIARGMGIRRRVTLLQSDHPSLLFTWGHFHPVIILPRDAAGWSDARARIVLAHELAHIRRGDWLALMSAQVLRAVYWFNPLAWIVERRLRDESERACDDEVMGLGVEGAQYAAELLALARILNAERPGWVAVPAMARPSSLERRVTAMVNDHVNRQPVGRAPRVLILALTLALAVVIGGFTTAAQTFASFGGSVVDPTGSVVTGVTLSMTNTQTGQQYQVKSSDVGSFEFVGLTPGQYEFETWIAGFKTTKAPMTMTSKNVRSDIRLEVGSLEETITVVDRGEPRSEPAAPRVRGGGVLPEKPACVAKPTGGFIAQPTKIADVRPIYPRSGGIPKADGVVVLDARIGTDGTVVEAHGVDPAADPDLVSAAIEAVKLWRYTPTLLNCIPIEVEMKVTVNFRTE